MDLIAGLNGELAGTSLQDGSGAAIIVLDHLNAEERDLQSLCRACLAVKRDMYSLVHGEDNAHLPKIFTSFTDIQLDAEEGLPLQICEPCKAQLVNSYEFRLQCLRSNCTLQSYLKPVAMGVDVKTEELDSGSSTATNASDLIKAENQEGHVDEDAAEDQLEDVQYLEDISDSEEESTLCIVQDATEIQRQKIELPAPESEISKGQSDRKANKKSGKKLKSKNTCEFCQKKFKTAVSLKGHIKRMHSTREPAHPNACNQCKESFESKRDLWLHSALHAGSGDEWKCYECHKEFGHKAALRRHTRRHMEGKRYACSYCGKLFAEHYALLRHVRVHTGQQPEKKYHCLHCDKRYSESYQLTAHLKRHSGVRPCVCADCGKTFASARLLASHALVHSEVKPYQCQFCDKRFRHESTRNTHHRTHTGERPYVCATCGKAFIQHCNLTLHMRSHTGEKPYSCKTCQRCFSSGSTLKAHLRTHTGERPYACHHCGKQLSRAGLHAHCRMHARLRPHECAPCGRRFATAARLRDHNRVHTGEKPFECNDCNMKFTTKGQLVKHFKTHSTKRKRPRKERPTYDTKQLVVINEEDAAKIGLANNTDKKFTDYSNRIVIDAKHEYPIGVSEELVLQNDGEIKTDIIVVDEPQCETLCLNNSINFVNNDVYTNEMIPTNLVTVNEENMSISASSAMIEVEDDRNATVKLYQVDQSLVQIHSSGGQLTISKITSKMTANF